MSFLTALNNIWTATKKGWDSAGVQWRKEFIEHGVHPDKFAELPNSQNLLDRYLTLDKQSKVQFLNTMQRNYKFLRYE